MPPTESMLILDRAGIRILKQSWRQAIIDYTLLTTYRKLFRAWQYLGGQSIANSKVSKALSSCGIATGCNAVRDIISIKHLDLLFLTCNASVSQIQYRDLAMACYMLFVVLQSAFSPA